MKFDFTDSDNRYYEFELDAEPSIMDPHVEITIYGSAYQSSITLPSITIRPIIDGKVQWHDPDDQWKVSLEAKRYLDKVIKNKAFL